MLSCEEDNKSRMVSSAGQGRHRGCGCELDDSMCVCVFTVSQVNKMSLDEIGDGDPMRFKLVDKTPGSDLRLLCQAASLDEKQNWLSQIQNILKMQENFFKGNLGSCVKP